MNANNSNNTNTMENTNTTNVRAELNSAVENLINAIRTAEEKKMIFTITRTAHYKGDKPKGVLIVECLDFDELEKFGIKADGSFARAKFPHNHGRGYKGVREMTCGTILKPQAGEYIQRIK